MDVGNPSNSMGKLWRNVNTSRKLRLEVFLSDQMEITVRPNTVNWIEPMEEKSPDPWVPDPLIVARVQQAESGEEIRKMMAELPLDPRTAYSLYVPLLKCPYNVKAEIIKLKEIWWPAYVKARRDTSKIELSL